MKKQKILIRPILTEKFLKLQEEKKGQYAFEVAQDANKIEIKNAVEKKFDVAVDQVRTLTAKGKTKQMNTKRGITKGSRPDIKKAIVTLREGDSIDFFGNS